MSDETQKNDVVEALPQGLTEFNAWADAIIEAAGAPNNDSVRFTLAGIILHAPEDAAYKPKSYFIIRLKKLMANQVASFVMHELKEKQKADIAAAAAQAKPTEATVLSVVPDAPQGQ